MRRTDQNNWPVPLFQSFPEHDPEWNLDRSNRTICHTILYPIALYQFLIIFFEKKLSLARFSQLLREFLLPSFQPIDSLSQMSFGGCEMKNVGFVTGTDDLHSTDQSGAPEESYLQVAPFAVGSDAIDWFKTVAPTSLTTLQAPVFDFAAHFELQTSGDGALPGDSQLNFGGTKFAFESASPTRDVVFIDSRVSDVADLLSGLKPGERAFVLNPDQDGLAQIASIISADHLSGLKGIQIVAHGGSGEIELGNTILNGSDLAGSAPQLSEIGGAIDTNGALSLYACDVAEGTGGQQFVADLSQYAGVDVNASTRDIGSADLGGSWSLNYDTGPNAAIDPFTSASLHAYEGILTTGVFTVENETFGNETVGADLGLACVIGNGDIVVPWQHGDQSGVNGSQNFNEALDAFDVNGNRIGSETSESTQFDYFQVAIPASTSNEFWVVSDIDNSSTPDYDATTIVAREFQISGSTVSLVTSQTIVNTASNDADNEYSSVVQLSNGDYVVAWSQSTSTFSSSIPVAEVYDSNFNALTSTTTIGGSQGNIINVRETASGNDIDVSYEAGNNNFYGVTFAVGSNGAISGISSPINLTADAPSGATVWGQNVLSNGDLLVMYSTLGAGGGSGFQLPAGDLYGAIYGPGFSGSPTPFIIADATESSGGGTESPNDGEATLFANGDYIVTYARPNGGSGTGNEEDIYARIYNSNNTALTNEFLVDTPAANVENEAPNVTAANGGAGGLLFTWTEINFAAYQYPPQDIEARIYSDVGPISNGAASSLADIFENTNPAGASVSSLITGGQYDSILGHPFGGIAVVGNAATSAQGVWQYSSNGGASWSTISTGVSDTNATIVASTDLVRFDPAANASGAPGGLTVLVWDGQDGFTADSTGQNISSSIFDTSDTTQSTASFTGAFAGTSISLGTNVIGLNLSPSANDVAGTTVSEGAGAGVLSSGINLDGHTLTVTSVAGSAGNVGSTIHGSYGDLTLNSDGSYTYVAGATGGEVTALANAATGAHPTDVFTYVVSDGAGATATADLTITLDRLPVGNTDAVTVFAGASSTASTYGAGALSVDSDPDGDTLAVTAISGGTVGTSLAGTYGHLTLNPDGTYTYTAYNSTAINAQPDNAVLTDTFTYTLSDQHGATTTAELVFTVDQAPTVSSLTASATSSANFSAAHTVTFTLDVGKNVTVAGGTTLLLSDGGTATYVSGSGTQAITFTYSATDAPGSLTVNSISAGSIADAAGNALALAGTSVSTYTDAVTDSAANVASNFGSLDSAVSYISSITLNDTGTPNLDLTASEIVNDRTLIGKIVSSYNLIANDTASAIGGAFDSLETYVASISAVIFTDSGTPTLDLTQTQVSNDSSLLAKVQGPYDLLVSDVTGQAYTSYQNDYNASDTLTATTDFNSDGTETIYGYAKGLTLTGNADNDTFRLQSAADVTATGGAGNDTFFFGSAFSQHDQINGGGGANTLELDGTYTGVNALAISSSMMSNIQTLHLATGHSYDITLDAGTVTTGQSLTVAAAQLVSGDSLTFNASAITGGALVIDAGAGADDLTGGGGTNTFNMAGYLTASDEINGGTGTSSVHLAGNYASGLTFTATTMVNVQTLDLAAGDSYNLTLNSATVAGGQTLTIQASGLGAGDSLTLNGSAVDGNLVVYAGSGSSFIEGGLGADKLYAGSGADTFAYAAVGDSTGATFDTITGFNTGSDKIDLIGSLSGVTAIDAAVATGVLGPTNFNTVLAHDIGAGQLQAGGAVLFTPSSGGYAGGTFLIIDENGVAGYQAGQDLVIELSHGVSLASLSVSNFETVG